MTHKGLSQYTRQEADLLRGLADQLAEVACSERNILTRERWRRVNDLLAERPVVMCYTMPWNELNVNDELTLQCSNTFLREIETDLRRQLYMHHHMPLDMVVEPYIKCRASIEESDYGLQINEAVIKTDETSQVSAHLYRSVINCMEDVEKLQPAVVTYDKGATMEAADVAKRIFAGILDVRIECVPDLTRAHAPWDYLVQRMGAENVFMNLYDQPEMMLALAKRYCGVALDRLDQYEKLGILSQNIDNTFVGAGGYGYTSELQAASPVTPANMWGASAAQLFTNISADMFEEFAVDCELDWLHRFALTYYGCCEALDGKIQVLRKIKNLRKISVSAWADPFRAAEQIGKEYVYSYKPNPAQLASDTLDEDGVKREITNAVNAARQFGCPMEILLKTLTTVRYSPQKLWRWAEIAQEIVESI